MLSDGFVSAVESWDREALADALAEDVTFRSPVVFKPYEGREATLAVLEAVSRVFEDFSYIDRVEGERTAALIFRARVGERELEGLDHLTFDEDGRVAGLRVMVRPMTGMQALAEAMQRQLEALG
jgi:SnoaL-like domain